jgi:hypothetical protein
VSSAAPQPTVAQIEHIALMTNNTERLYEFYRLLGATAEPAGSASRTGARSRVLDFCGVGLELFAQPGPRALPPGLVRLGFALGSADAVDELTQVIAAAGHRVIERPHRTGELARYESIVLDPDGNWVMLTV